MKVLQINATYGYSSTGLIVKDIGDTLVATGNEAFFAYQSARGEIENGYPVGNRLDRKVHALLCRVFGRQGYYSRSATKKLINHIEEIKPDVVHLHNLHSNFVHVNMLLQYLAKNDVPTVITMHDCWFFTGKCFHYADIGCERYKSGCGRCPKKKAPPASMLFDSTASVLRDRDKLLHAIPRLKVVGCSEWVCNEAKKGIMKDLELMPIRNGVDTNVFKPYDKTAVKRELNLEDKFVIMGMANKWLLPSNVEFLNKMKSHLAENDRIVLVGCTEQQMSALQSEEKIIAVGFVKGREALAKYYAAANVFVNVTHADTLPTVNMESICCGTPVVTYDSCGSPEIVLEGCGYVVPEGDVDGIVEKIKNVKSNVLRSVEAIGKANFDKTVCYRKYVELYKDIVG